MESTTNITLMAYIWANRLATNENVVIHWCKHYMKMPISSFNIVLNVNSDIDDSPFFTEIFKSHLRNVTIYVDRHKYSSHRMNDFMNSVICSNKGLFIPVDYDEFIEYDLDTESKKLQDSQYVSMGGTLVDRVCLKDGKILLKNPNIDEPIEHQFPKMDDLRRITGNIHNKIVLIKQDQRLIPGHHGHIRQARIPNYPDANFKVMHYCWTNTTLLDRSTRSDFHDPRYMRLVNSIKNSEMFAI
jgi:hypothetical protein